MRRSRAFGVAFVAIAGALGACRSPDEANDCYLQIQIYFARPSLTVGDSLKLSAWTLPMLPPGRACGEAAITWSLSDSTLASLVRTGDVDAIVTARRPGTLIVRAHGTVRDHQADASVTITIPPPPLPFDGTIRIDAITDTFGVNVDPNRLRGTVVATAYTSFNAPDTLLMDFGVDSASLCVKPPPIRSRPISCRIDLDETRDGTWRFPSGTHTLRASVRDSAGHVLMSATQAIVIAERT